MNKPAPKEPSMDEILSSIRQIIADDDAAVAPRAPSVAAAAAPSVQPAPPPRPIGAAAPRPAPEPEPLALTPEQMLTRPAPAEPADVDHPVGAEDEAGEPEFETPPQLVDPEDVAFDSGDEAGTATPVGFAPENEGPGPEPRPVPPPIVPPPRFAPPHPRPAPSVARAAPMPDPTLSSDMAESLLEPATDAAVKSTFARLNGISMAGSGLTIDALMREMLRPMLKEWLDEHLPAVVERMVEKEIARISRGGE